MLDQALINAYQSTIYRVPELNLDIRIGQLNRYLKEVLMKNKVNSWAFITAWNPKSRLLSRKENSSLNQLLLDDLNSYICFKGLGIPDTDDWQSEESFLVLGITKGNALELCHKYNQNTIVFGTIDTLPELINASII